MRSGKAARIRESQETLPAFFVFNVTKFKKEYINKMHLNSITSFFIILFCFFTVLVTPAYASYQDNIGYSMLQAELGSSLPSGSGVNVSLVEAATSWVDHDANPETYNVPVYLPDPANSQFSGKTLNIMSGSESGLYSSHATGTGSLFFGNSSQSPGINNIDCFLADHWIGTGFLNSGYGTLKPLSSSSRVATHSWVGSFTSTDDNCKLLRRLDWVVETDEFIQVAAMNNGSTNRPLLGSSFNAITVGRTDSNHPRGSFDLDSTYTAGRVRPDIVAPMSTTSSATPVVASAVALLVDTGHSNPGLSTDPVITHTTNRNGDTIYNAERSEVIKAALMAGADRYTDNDIEANITDYRADAGDRTDNGLDIRFGAGQVNIFNSYHIIAGGEQNSFEDLENTDGEINLAGFDYDPSFGGLAGSNSKASYYFTTEEEDLMLTASLVWNIAIDGGSEDIFNGAAELYDFDLYLHDITDAMILGSSESTVNNTENLWVFLEDNHDYMLQVLPGKSQEEFQWDYALAWQMNAAPVPIPGAVWLLGSALMALAGIKRKVGQSGGCC